MDKELAKKFKIKPEHSLLIVNRPKGYLTKSLKPHQKITRGKMYDFVILFITDKRDLDRLAPKVLKKLDSNSLFWIAYPKKRSSLKTDINRDYGWAALTSAGYKQG